MMIIMKYNKIYSVRVIKKVFCLLSCSIWWECFTWFLSDYMEKLMYMYTTSSPHACIFHFCDVANFQIELSLCWRTQLTPGLDSCLHMVFEVVSQSLYSSGFPWLFPHDFLKLLASHALAPGSHNWLYMILEFLASHY